MIKMNNMMKTLIEAMIRIENDILKIRSKDLNKILAPNFIEINDVVLLKLADDNNIFKQISLEKIIQIYGDKTGYEASCNEFYVNQYLDYEEGTELLVLGFGVQLLECWSYKLKHDFPQYKFNLILGYSKGQVTLRFHKLRANETEWLDSNLENYKHEGIMLKRI